MAALPDCNPAMKSPRGFVFVFGDAMAKAEIENLIEWVV